MNCWLPLHHYLQFHLFGLKKKQKKKEKLESNRFLSELASELMIIIEVIKLTNWTLTHSRIENGKKTIRKENECA